MLQSSVRQPPHSRYSDCALQIHLRQLGAQSSHGRPARSPTNVKWRQLPLHTKTWPAWAVRVRDHIVGMRERR